MHAARRKVWQALIQHPRQHYANSILPMPHALVRPHTLTAAIPRVARVVSLTHASHAHVTPVIRLPHLLAAVVSQERWGGEGRREVGMGGGGEVWKRGGAEEDTSGKKGGGWRGGSAVLVARARCGWMD